MQFYSNCSSSPFILHGAFSIYVFLRTYSIFPEEPDKIQASPTTHQADTCPVGKRLEAFRRSESIFIFIGEREVPRPLFPTSFPLILILTSLPCRGFPAIDTPLPVGDGTGNGWDFCGCAYELRRILINIFPAIGFNQS